MNVSLTPELERLVNEKVESGLYQTASEVVREVEAPFLGAGRDNLGDSLATVSAATDHAGLRSRATVGVPR